MKLKRVITPEYKSVFDPENGNFMRFGETENDDPQYSPIGPELADIEISTICSVGCKHCYKSNTSMGKNMSIDSFKKVLGNLPKSVNQIAFGIGDIDANPDMFDIFRHCREMGVVPNVTVSGYGFSWEWAGELASLCGAVAVSNYDRDVCYNAVRMLTQEGCKQVNIHQLLSDETYGEIIQLQSDIKNGERRLEGLNAVVFLSLKKRGRGILHNRISDEDLEDIVEYCVENEIPFGFDSCSYHRFVPIAKRLGIYEYSLKYAEPCESCLFSIYVNVEGNVYPCSFCEEERLLLGNAVEKPIFLDFLNDIWYCTRSREFRSKLILGERRCPIYEI